MKFKPQYLFLLGAALIAASIIWFKSSSKIKEPIKPEAEAEAINTEKNGSEPGK
jgi:hypothetical protein